MRSWWYGLIAEYLVGISIFGVILCDDLSPREYAYVGFAFELVLIFAFVIGVGIEFKQCRTRWRLADMMKQVRAFMRFAQVSWSYIFLLVLLVVVFAATVWGVCEYLCGLMCNYVSRMTRHPFWSALILALCVMLTAKILASWRRKISWAHELEHRRAGYKRRDAPEDKLSRSISVDAILKALRHPDSVGTEYVGFFGCWGEGKTFVLEQVKDKLSEEKDLRLELVDFCPWRCMNKKFLPLALFECVGEAVDRRMNANHSYIFNRFGMSVAGVQVGEFLGALPTVGGILRAVWEFWMPNEKLKDRLNGILKRYKDSFRVVVVIDDVDRLPPDDICDLTRLICANGNLDNVTYLVAADKKYLARALQKMVGIRTDDIRDGNAYLEKVFRKRIYLPKLPADRLPGEFCEWLHGFCNQNSLDYPEKELGGAIGEFIFSFLRTMRDVEVLCNAVANEYVEMTQILGAQPNVYLADFVALMAIKYYEEDFYNSIFANRKEYINFTNVLVKDLARQFTEVELKKLLANDADEVAWSRMLKFLNSCVGLRCVSGVEKGGASQYRYDVDQDVATSNFRLQSAFCFENYFTGLTASGLAVGRTHLNEFYDSIGDTDKAVKLLEDMARHGGLGVFLRVLANQLQSPIMKHVPNFMRVLCRISERVFDGELLPVAGGTGTDSGRDVFDYIRVCVKRVLEDSDTHPRSVYSHALLDVFESENSIKLLAWCIEVEHKQHGERGANSPIAWFTDDDFDSLQKLYLRHFVHLQSAGKLFNAPLNHSIRKVAVRVAKNIGDAAVNEVRDCIKTDIGQYPNVLEIARLFSVELEERPAVMILGVNYIDLEKFVGVERMRESLKVHVPIMSAQAYAYYKILCAMIERAQTGASIDENAQSAYLHNDNELRLEILDRLGDTERIPLAPPFVWT